MGLAGAGERSQRKPLFPNLMRKRVFDLGCGYGWQCKFAAEQGVMCVLGIDRSTKMIAKRKDETRTCALNTASVGSRNTNIMRKNGIV